MQKKIGIAALSVLGLCSYALAADTSPSDTSAAQDTTTQTYTHDSAMNDSNQQAGTVGSDSSDTTPAQTTESSNVMTSKTQKVTKNCTDSNGVTYKRGENGYKSCLHAMKKSEKSDQMGGKAGSDIDSQNSGDSAASGSSSTDSATTHNNG